MKLNFDKTQCFVMPAKLYQLFNSELEQITPQQSNASAITLNFRDLDYSAELGGYHPVEIRLERHQQFWRLIYITEFSFQGLPFPELLKEIDICFKTAQVFSLFGGCLNNKSGKGLITLFVGNFVEYHAMAAYLVSVTFN